MKTVYEPHNEYRFYFVFSYEKCLPIKNTSGVLNYNFYHPICRELKMKRNVNLDICSYFNFSYKKYQLQI